MQAYLIGVQLDPSDFTEHELSKVVQSDNVNPEPVFLVQSNLQAVVEFVTAESFVHPNLYNSHSDCVPLNVVQSPIE